MTAALNGANERANELFRQEAIKVTLVRAVSCRSSTLYQKGISSPGSKAVGTYQREGGASAYPVPSMSNRRSNNAVYFLPS